MITDEDARKIAESFVREYPGAIALAYKMKRDTASLYGELAIHMPSDMKGGYLPKPLEHKGIKYNGRVDIALENIRDANDLLVTLRHEVLGHFGVNTFPAAEKRALLDGILASQEQSSMAPLWKNINARYSNDSWDMRAEEVFALYCEQITPDRHQAFSVRENGENSFFETCIARTRPMEIEDLGNIVCMVAAGIADRTRTQQNFPRFNAMFRKDDEMEKKPFHVSVAEKLIEQLETNTAPWQKLWEPGETGLLPINPTTGNRYKGINAIQLLSENRSDNRWLTYKQAAAIGAQVRRGEKGTQIQYWKFSEEQTVLDESGKAEKITVKLERPRVFMATVFNAEQIDGMPVQQKKHRSEAEVWEAHQRAEQIIQSSGAVLQHEVGNRAFYKVSTDTITLPLRAQFKTADNYYAVALHELGHWTGHETRLNRDIQNPFGSQEYAKEELRAEIGSMMLGDELGIGHDPSQHAAYVGSWINVLKNDPMEIFRAAADAEKIHNYIMAFEQEQIQEAVQEATMNVAEAPATVADIQQQEEREVLALLQSSSERATPGYSSLESWLTLQRTAEEKGAKANLTWNKGDEFDADVLVTYQEPSGFVLPVHTELYSGDGKAVSLVNGQRLFRTGLTAEAEWQADALVSAIETARKQHQSEAVSEHQRTAEQWVLNTLGTKLDTSIATMNSKQVETVQGVLQSTQPLSIENPFWQRHEQAAASMLPKSEHLEAGIASAQLAVDTRNEQLQLNQSAEKIQVADLAREQEVHIRRDPDSSANDIAGARELRKNAEDIAISSIIQTITAQDSAAIATEQTWLAVPYEQRDQAKLDAGKLPNGKSAIGYDKAQKCWYAKPGADLSRLQKYRLQSNMSRQNGAADPVDEFADALRSMGCIVDNDHPIMDGKNHRIEVVGDRDGKKSGHYRAFLDGVPNGYIKNFKQDKEFKWTSKGYLLSPEQKAAMQAEAAIQREKRTQEEIQKHENSALRVQEKAAMMTPLTAPTPYLLTKGIEVHDGLLTDKKSSLTCIPAYSADGKMWTMQYISEDGTKRFAKDGRKEGCFHPVGGFAALAAAPVIAIGEGYATCATGAEILGHSTVAAFDSGNLLPVANALREQFPDKPIIFLRDDDRHLLFQQGKNTGREAAEAAASAVNGYVLAPVFSVEETEYPKNVPPVTPELFRAHEMARHALRVRTAEGTVELSEDVRKPLEVDLLKPEQLAALEKLKVFTDFNDLVMKSSLGRKGAERQIIHGVREIMEQHQSQSHQATQSAARNVETTRKGTIKLSH